MPGIDTPRRVSEFPATQPHVRATDVDRPGRVGPVARRAVLAGSLAVSVFVLDTAAGAGPLSEVALSQARPGWAGVHVLATRLEPILRHVRAWPDADLEAALLVVFGLLLIYVARVVSRARRRRPAPLDSRTASRPAGSAITPFRSRPPSRAAS